MPSPGWGLLATVAEVCFAAQWAIVLHLLGRMTGVETTLNAAWVIVPLILAECFSWHAVLTRNYLGNSIENSMGGCFLHCRGWAFPVASRV
jgi:hypothetical protein